MPKIDLIYMCGKCKMYKESVCQLTGEQVVEDKIGSQCLLETYDKRLTDAGSSIYTIDKLLWRITQVIQSGCDFYPKEQELSELIKKIRDITHT